MEGEREIDSSRTGKVETRTVSLVVETVEEALKTMMASYSAGENEFTFFLPRGFKRRD